MNALPFSEWLELTNKALSRREREHATEVEAMPWYQRGIPWNVAVVLIADERNGPTKTYYRNDPAEGERLSECDCCGQMKYGCRNIIAMGMDTHACEECMGNEEGE